MEIRQYLRTAGRRRWLLVLLPAAALCGTVPWAVAQPPTYEAAGSIVVPNEGADAHSPAELRQIVDSVVAVAQSEHLASEVSRVTGVPAQRVHGNLTAAPVGITNLVEVRFVHTNLAKTRQVVEVAGAVAMRTYRQTTGSSLRTDIRSYEKTYEGARAELADFVDEFGPLLPPQGYAQQIRLTAQLERSLEAARDAGDGVAEDELEDQLKDARAELTTRRDAVLEYQRLEEIAQRASLALDSTRLEASVVNGRQADSTTNHVLISSVSRVPGLAVVLQAVLGGIGVGVLIAAALLLLMEARGRRNRDRVSGATGDDQSDPKATGDPANAREKILISR